MESDLYEQFLKPEMGRLGYEGAFLKLSGKKDAAIKIGVATFFHSRTFRLLKVSTQQQHHHHTTRHPCSHSSSKCCS